MNSGSTSGAVAAAETDLRVQQARMVMLFRGLTSKFLLTPVVVVLLAAAYFWPHLPVLFTAPWIVWMLVVIASSWALGRRFARRPSRFAWGGWERRVLWHRVALGTGWAVFISAAALHAVDWADQVFLSVLFLGILAHGLALLAASRQTYAGLLLPSAVCVPAVCFWTGGTFYAAMGTLAVVSIIFATAIQRRIHRNVLGRLRQSAENRTLAKRLRAAEQALKDTGLEEASIFQTVDVGIVILRNRRIVRCNFRLAQMMGTTPESLAGRDPSDFHVEHDEWLRIGREIMPAIRAAGRYETDVRLKRCDGTTFWAHANGRPIDYDDLSKGSVWGLTDITSRRTREAEITQLAYYDPLTGLPNRRLLEERLSEALLAAGRSRSRLALIVLDCDNFKAINDSHGHGVGDRVLVTVAERLRHSVRESDMVSRLGGDEFVILLPDLGRADAIEIVAEKILHAMEGPMLVEGLSLSVGVSMGIALFPRDGETASALTQTADGALYRAKQAGRNTYRFHLRTG